MDGAVRSSVRSYARSLDQPRFYDPYITLTLTLETATPNIMAVKIWQSDGDNTNGCTRDITVWLHEFGQVPTSGLANGNADSFLSGVVCASGVWPTSGDAGMPQSRTALCNQTIGSPGAKYVTLQKFTNYTLYSTSAYLNVAEVQVLADGERVYQCAGGS